MDIFDVLNLIGGLCLFLFGMNLMGAALEKRAGHSLTSILSRLTSGKFKGFLTGLVVTSIIQSSSVTTVMVVGFVNSGIMNLRQAINVIMGANVGTTVTAWLLALTGIEGSSLFIQLLKPTSFTPILALVGIVLYMSGSGKRRDTATILLGFATLMFGMDTMSGAVAGLKDVPEFRNILTLFSNPLLGVLTGAVLTGIIQSSSASVGILQALSSTGQVNFGAAIPIIMGQNIGTCVTALFSSVGTNRNARRASIVHLLFNIIGTAVLLTLFTLAKHIFDLSDFVNSMASETGIAIAHSAFNILCTAMLLPASGLLEKLSYMIVPEPKDKEQKSDGVQIDERLMATPAVALEQCRSLTDEMVDISVSALRLSAAQLSAYDADSGDAIRKKEEAADKYEAELGSYLVKLNSRSLSEADSVESARLLHMIGNLERLSDYALDIQRSAEELRTKGIKLTPEAGSELAVLLSAADEMLSLAVAAFRDGDMRSAFRARPLKLTIDSMKSRMRSEHIRRMQKGECSIEAGFIWSDILTGIGRAVDNCCDIAECMEELAGENALTSLDGVDQLGLRREYEEKYPIHSSAAKC